MQSILEFLKVGCHHHLPSTCFIFPEWIIIHLQSVKYKQCLNHAYRNYLKKHPCTYLNFCVHQVQRLFKGGAYLRVELIKKIGHDKKCFL